MDLRIEGKTALVTGSTAGIGLAIAMRLAEEGAIIIINGRSSDRVATAVDQVKKAHPKAKVSGLAADLSNAEGCQTLIKNLPYTQILINNVGIYEPKAVDEITDEDWERLLQVNVFSGIRLSRHYLPLMRQKKWGRIIFISSESGVNIPKEMVHYGVTKTAQIALARGLAETTVGTEVTVNSVLPGPTWSEGLAGFADQLSAMLGADENNLEEQFFTKARPTSLLRRFAKADEVASLVAYLCSPLACATNGAAVRCEGGLLRSIT
jgi:NAD(P)-dependent dehydrogenase (short-subunit alcohol dehydrogenase family)